MAMKRHVLVDGSWAVASVFPGRCDEDDAAS